ncbi:MAG TPA: hypothetical protein VI548_01695, partial [Chitinophagaceae bacterium]|nr:hypothetical protein [Chitinophagaceae bacterium]
MYRLIQHTNKEEFKTNLFYWLCTGFVYSMLFWTLLNSMLAILIVAFWLFFLKKEFHLSSDRSKLMLLFISLYVIGLIGLIYTGNMTQGKAILQKQSALLFFPLVFGSSTVLSFQLLKKLISHYLIATGLACIAGLGIGMYNYIITGNIAAVTGRGLLVFHAFNPMMMGLYCLLALSFLITYENFSHNKFNKWLIALSFILSLFIFLLSIRIIIFCWLLLVLYFLWKIVKKNIYKIFLTIGLIFSLVLSGLFLPALKKQWKELADFSMENNIVLDKDSSLERSWGGKALRVA